MIGLNFSYEGMQETAQDMRDLGVEVMPITRRVMYNELLGYRNTLTKRGALPARSYPPTPYINWDNEIQRRAYFASDGFGHGIPTRRTGKTADAWRVVRAGEGYAIENPEEAAIYLFGDENMQGQSNIHKGRWPLWAQKLDEVVNRIPPEAEQEIQKYAERKGF